MYDVDKLREYFPSTTVYKDPSVMSMFKAAKIESFLRDWILKRKTGVDGVIEDKDALSEYVASIIPQRSEKERLQDEARTEGETRFFLAKLISPLTPTQITIVLRFRRLGSVIRKPSLRTMYGIESKVNSLEKPVGGG